jgi:hypothetical protein
MLLWCMASWTICKLTQAICGYNEPEDDLNYKSKHAALVKNNTLWPHDKQEIGWIQYSVVPVVV